MCMLYATKTDILCLNQGKKDLDVDMVTFYYIIRIQYTRIHYDTKTPAVVFQRFKVC